MSACIGHANYIRSLEHVQVQLSLSYSRRGDLEISLTSPMGTRSTLVAIRCGGRGPAGPQTLFPERPHEEEPSAPWGQAGWTPPLGITDTYCARSQSGLWL